MTAFRLAILAAALLAAGCSATPQPPPQARAIAPDVPPEADLQPPDDPTPQLLARKTARYAQDLSPLLPQRRSGVEWADPDELRLESTPVSMIVSIDAPAPPHEPFEVTAPATQPAPLPLTPARGADAAPVDLDELQRALARQAQDYPRDLAGQLDHQLLLMLRDHAVPDLSALAALPMEDRELLTALLDGLSNFRNALRADNNMLLSKKIRPILDLADRLRSQADLSISTIALCTQVEGFGVYEPIDPPRFPAGREHPLIVYCEVANFASQLASNNVWETRLTQEAVLYTETGLPVWQDKTRTITDQSRNRRHDFFIVKMMKLPANLTIGRYVLKVTVIDQQASRVAEATLPVQIVAQ